MAKKKAGTGAPLNKTPQLTALEREVQDLLDQDADGNLDNVFDIIDELVDFEERLPANSALRPAWDEFHAGCMKIVEDSAKRHAKKPKK
jgi:hypothetical protein